VSCLTSLPQTCTERVFNEKPTGSFDDLNLTFLTAQPFVFGSLVVRLDGVTLDPDQYIVGPSGFTLLVDASDPKALNRAPRGDECLRVDYDVSAQNGCLTIL
jgi:hypothetical protein